MKRKFNRVFKDEQNINKNLICPICHDVFDRPVRSTCGHTFCQDCIQHWAQHKANCPLCRKIIHKSYFQKDIIPHKMVQELDVACSNTQCTWKGDLQSLPSHLKDCEFEKNKEESEKAALDQDSEHEIEQRELTPQAINDQYAQRRLPPSTFQLQTITSVNPFGQQQIGFRFTIPLMQQFSPLWGTCFQVPSFPGGTIVPVRYPMPVPMMNGPGPSLNNQQQPMMYNMPPFCQIGVPQATVPPLINPPSQVA